MSDDLSATPAEVTDRLAERVGVASSVLGRYSREVERRLRREHVARVVERAGWTGCGRGECKALGDWLVARALEINQLSTVTGEVVETAREALIIGS